ncbi:MAG: hypothetical protein AB7S26_09625 [Sandaracinaceae bacterium]
MTRVEAWPIEEGWLRPGLSLLLAALLPWAAAAGTARFFDDRERARRGSTIVRATSLVIAFALGRTALGPMWVSSRDALPAVGFGIVGLLAAWAADREVARKLGLAPLTRTGELAMSVAAILFATAIGSALELPARPAIESGAGLVILLAASTRGERPRDATELSFGVATSVMVVAALALAWHLTAIDVDAAPHAGGGMARWRLRIDPWDGAAMLASAWASHDDGAPERARARLAEARRMGIPEGPALELLSELAASEGDCALAHQLFDRALRARAADAFENDPFSDAEPLVLGGYHLPPALVTECGGL